MQLKMKFGTRGVINAVVTAGLLSMVPLATASAAQVGNEVAIQAQAQALQTWHQDIKRMGPPVAGCWSVSYPGHIWKQEACVTVSSQPTPPVVGSAVLGNSATNAAAVRAAAKAGAGYDYSAVTSHLTRSATGSFPVVRGVKSESGPAGANKYTLQLNTNASDGVGGLGNTSTYCAHNGYRGCSTWQQFIYSTTNGAYIQNWVFIGKDDLCPTGWRNVSSSYHGCFHNSKAVAAPNVPVANLAKVKFEGIVSANGLDTVTFTYNGKAYAISQDDSTLEIASTWLRSEFNIVGDGSQSSAANFNTGSSLTVNLAVDDGTTHAPTCLGPKYGGTTGEYNNLALGKCVASGGATPSIRFTESN